MLKHNLLQYHLKDMLHCTLKEDLQHHCLPVRRNLIVTDDVIESPNSLVIPEAANREISCSVVIKRMLEAL